MTVLILEFILSNMWVYCPLKKKGLKNSGGVSEELAGTWE